MSQRTPRIENESHLKFIRRLQCVVCGRSPCEAAHVRFNDARAAKVNSGMRQKPHDRWAVPVCSDHHRQQHTQGERKWWGERGIDPVFIALALWSVSGDEDAGSQIVRHAYFHS